MPPSRFAARVPAAFLASVLVAVIAACTPRPPAPPEEAAKLVVEPADFSQLPGWAGDDHRAALPALARSCAKLDGAPDDRSLGVAGRVADWREPCRALAQVPPGDEDAARAYFEAWFRPWAAAAGKQPEGLFTGYYEPELRGSRVRTGTYTVPLYRRPADLVMVDLGEFRENLKGERIAGRVVDGRLRPFEDREAIEAGALAGQGLELAWVADPISAFFLHIQGSGRVVLDDGDVLRVGYDGQNGHLYHAIGRDLIERGEIPREAMSLQAIRAWLDAHPDEASALMARNPSYVFFRSLPGEGPMGAQGVPLTPGRSLAVDRRFIPYGVPVWLDAEDPLDPGKRLQRVLVAQDTGGAIRGPVRGDVFWGYGPEAEERAGHMKSRGRYWLLLPRTVAPPS